MHARTRDMVWLAIPVVLTVSISGRGVAASAGPGVGTVPQGAQTDRAYAQSFGRFGVTNVDATSQQTSCYTPEVPYVTVGAGEGYSGMSACNGASTTGEDLGPYATQAGSNPGYPAAGPMLVKDHSESDIRVDPTNPSHLLATSKWIVSPEGYNHLLGFYASWDGGQTWPVQGHIPGYEGWTDNTDPVGAFDRYGNYYQINLPYQFYYNSDGSHNFATGSLEPNPSLPNEVISMAVLPAAAAHNPNGWVATRNGHPDYIATYDSSSKGNGPDKEWVTIDTDPHSPLVDTIYAMWVDFHFATPVPFVSVARARPDGTHTAWSAPIELPAPPHAPQGVTYLLPHVDPSGVVYTTLTNFNPKKGYCCAQIFVDRSSDGGASWAVAGTVGSAIAPPPLEYANTQFRDGIENTFAVGNQLINGRYPLFVSYEDDSLGYGNVILTASYDGGATWTNFEQVNDNNSAVDAFQPNLTVAADGTLSDAFYDRRLPCPAAGSAEASGAGLALDTVNLNYGGGQGPLPPYGFTNYCVNSSIQFYDEHLRPIGHNIRTSAHTWDPQLNEPRPAGVSASEGFIGDYYGNVTSGATDYTTSVSTYDDGTNPRHQQQQIIAAVAVP